MRTRARVLQAKLFLVDGSKRFSDKKVAGVRIQIVEDDHALSDGIVLALQEPETEFVQSESIRQARQDYERERPELVILDVNLPDGSGFDYLKWLREQSGLPVLVLTANDMEMDEVMGLSLGADDYMTKPFSLAVLRARIQALIRRIISDSSQRESDIYQEGEYSFDFDKMIFRSEGREISLSVNEQRLLRLFTRNTGRLLTRELLMERIWPDGEEYVDENALSVTVNRLRAKLVRKGAQSPIQTVYGQGYIWKGGSHVS